VEAIVGAKKPETRLRRIQAAVKTLAAKLPAKQPAAKSASTGRRLNTQWHQRHPMPKNPSTEQRIAWHLAHEKNCGCRPMPAKLRALMPC